MWLPTTTWELLKMMGRMAFMSEPHKVSKPMNPLEYYRESQRLGGIAGTAEKWKVALMVRIVRLKQLIDRPDSEGHTALKRLDRLETALMVVNHILQCDDPEDEML